MADGMIGPAGTMNINQSRRVSSFGRKRGPRLRMPKMTSIKKRTKNKPKGKKTSRSYRVRS